MTDHSATSTAPARRPLVTFALFAFNQEAFVRAAVAGALAQTYSPLEIILSDDCSSDRTFEIMQDAVKDYAGPHRILLRRNPANLGLARHINTVVAAARGDYIVLAAGDDVSRPERTAISVDAFREHAVSLVHSKVDYIDALGHPVAHKPRREPLLWGDFDLLTAAESRSLYIGATAAVSRRLFEKYGPIEFFNAFEDLILGFRAVLESGSCLIDWPLVSYRLGGGLSQAKTDSRKEIRKNKELRKIQAYVDVYRQRCLDFAKADVKDHRVVAVLNNKLQEAELRLARRSGMFDLFQFISRHPIASFKSAYRALRRRRI